MPFDWKVPFILAGLFFLISPTITKRTDHLDAAIEQQKAQLAVIKEVNQHQSEYQKIKSEMESKGESSWGSREVSDFLAELQNVSSKTQTSLIYLRPAAESGPPEEKKISAEVSLESDMKTVAKFLYEALELPGLMSIDRLTLSGEDVPGRVSAQIYLSRKFPSR